LENYCSGDCVNFRNHELTKPLISYYQNEKQAGNTEYFRIDGTQPVEEVTKELQKILG